MIMNPKLANELREDYGSAAMRAGWGGLPGGFSLTEAVEVSGGPSRVFNRFIFVCLVRAMLFTFSLWGTPLPPDLLESWD